MVDQPLDGTAGERLRWDRQSVAATALRVSITLFPWVFAVTASLVLHALVPRASSWLWLVLRVAVIAAASMLTLRVVERFARRFLPLTSLLKLSLVFPDQAPSRFKMALKAGSGKRMERAITDARENGLSSDVDEAAAQLVLFSTAISAHDRRTRGHSERVRLYADLLGEELDLTEDERQKLQWAALIHDLGKLTVPTEILNKRGRPDEAEWAVLKAHPANGEEMAQPLAEWLGEWIHAIGGHHERWDGAGYPRGLAGDDIPRAAAIVAVADAFEVMTAVRSYKSAMPLADARAELTRCAGAHFSPQIVRSFLNISLPKLRRVNGTVASLAHVPFLGPAITAGAKTPEAWGYALGNAATTVGNVGGSTFAAAAMTGIIATSGTAGYAQAGTTDVVHASRDAVASAFAEMPPAPAAATAFPMADLPFELVIQHAVDTDRDAASPPPPVDGVGDVGADLAPPVTHPAEDEPAAAPPKNGKVKEDKTKDQKPRAESDEDQSKDDKDKDAKPDKAKPEKAVKVKAKGNEVNEAVARP